MATQSLNFHLIVKNTFIDVDEDVPAKHAPLRKRAVTAPPDWQEDQSDAFRNMSDVSTVAASSDSDEEQASQVSESPVLAAGQSPLQIMSGSCTEPRREQCPLCVSTVCQVGVPVVYGQWMPMYGRWQLPLARDAQWQPMWALGEGQCNMAEKVSEPVPQEQAVETQCEPSSSDGQCRSMQLPAAQVAFRQVTSFVAADVPPTVGREWEALEKAMPFKPQSLSLWRNPTTQAARIVWTVDGKKFRGNDRLTVSPKFLLSDKHGNAPLPFKMVINPHGAGSFRKADGKAVVQLKCEAPREGQERITFQLSVGSGHRPDTRLQARRGPVSHNFGRSGICGLPKNCEVWNFFEVLDEESQTFVVILDVEASDVRLDK